jgi:anti-anti-sigma factor
VSGVSVGTAETSELEPGIWLVSIRGEHDLSTSSALEHALQGVRPESVLLVDLQEATFVDSNTLSALLCASRRSAEHGGAALFVAPPGGRVGRLFRITGLDLVLKLFETRDAALSSVQNHSS